MKKRWSHFWVYGALLREAGLTPDDSEITMKATGKAPNRVILGYNSQAKAWFEEYDPRPSGRIVQSLEPARAHAELVESDKQNRYAAELWKSHAEGSVYLTPREKTIVYSALQWVADDAQWPGLRDGEVTILEFNQLFNKMK